MASNELIKGKGDEKKGDDGGVRRKLGECFMIENQFYKTLNNYYTHSCSSCYKNSLFIMGFS